MKLCFSSLIMHPAPLIKIAPIVNSNINFIDKKIDEDFNRIIHQAGNTNNHQPIGLSSLNRIAHNLNFDGKIEIKKLFEMSVCFSIIINITIQL